MSEMNDAAIVAALRREMAVAVARQVAAAGNLANVDTPGYRTREVAGFDEVLDKRMGGALRMASTSGGHLQATAPRGGADTREVEGLAERRDGNTVQIDRELLMMTSAASDFAKAQTALAAKFRIVRYAINEGR